jgi:hypothetical protein
VSYTTYSLIYPERSWVYIYGMEKSWERADVDATIEKDTVTVKTKNVSGLGLMVGQNVPKILIDGTSLSNERGSHTLHKEGGTWKLGEPAKNGLIKHPRICGPIDHAFMTPFLFVRPTGKPLNDAIGKWTQSEMEHAIKSWRAVFRGDAPVKDDTAVTDEDIAKSNLILWGDPSSNAVLKKIADKLPVAWSNDALKFKTYQLEPARYVPVLIYPNPLNPPRYIVINSGHTFREFALLNNSDQTPKLPDWAIVDISVPAGPKWPGLIYDAGFFDENWK